MARISVVDEPFTRVLLQDLEKKQTLREHTIYPAGEERYLNPIDEAGLDAYLDEQSVTEDAATVIAGTVDADDISLANIDAVTTEALTTEQEQAIQDFLSVQFVETSNFLLSFNDGVISKLVELGWIKVFVDDGTALFSL